MFFKKENIKENSKNDNDKDGGHKGEYIEVKGHQASFEVSDNELIFKAHPDHMGIHIFFGLDTIKVPLDKVVYCNKEVIIIIKETYFYDQIDRIVKNKLNDYNKYKQIYIAQYFPDGNVWEQRTTLGLDEYTIETTSIYDKLPYGLIETKEEYDEYCNSKLDYNDWCRRKLVNKMLELDLGNGFIESFANLIGDDLNKYKQMIDLAEESNDTDVLMYLFVNKFGGKE